MTDLEINAAIAESLGYMDIYRCGQSGKRTEQGLLHGKLLCGTLDQPSINYGREYEFIKRYTHCLNAMHEAMLAHPRKDLLRKFLYLEVLEDPTNTTNEPAWATAKQWATAYVKSLGKWSYDD